jgi:sec-independent protein translocase protein TatA
MDIGPMELMLVLALVVVLFGANRIADLGSALGKSVREFRRAVQDEPDAPPPAPATPTDMASAPAPPTASAARPRPADFLPSAPSGTAPPRATAPADTPAPSAPERVAMR